MHKYFFAVCLVVLAATAVLPTSAKAETTNVSALLEQLQSLMKQVELLQKQLAEVKREIKEELQDGLMEGVETEDVKKIQELLASDPSLYPRGLVTGYYGPLTKEAVQRFQKRHELAETGVVDVETKALMLEYFKEKTSGKIPAGLLRAPGIDKKIMDRLQKYEEGMACEDVKGAKGLFCAKDDDDDQKTKKDNRRINNISASTTHSAISAAKMAAADLEDAIEVASSTSAAEEAEDDLADVEELIEKAEADYLNKKYRSAYDFAVKAKKLALKSLENINDGDDDVD